MWTHLPRRLASTARLRACGLNFHSVVPPMNRQSMSCHGSGWSSLTVLRDPRHFVAECLHGL